MKRMKPNSFFHTLATVLVLASIAALAPIITVTPVVAAQAAEPPVLLPDGTAFKMWEAPLEFSRTYHVDQRHPAASDTNPGTREKPFKTIGRAAEVLEAGERVVVAPGIYRERVRPARGGSGPASMVSYEAEPGAQVAIRGSRVFGGKWSQVLEAEGGKPTGAKQPRGWTAHLEAEPPGSYDPFSTSNVTDAQFEIMDWARPDRANPAYALVRGMVFQDGRRLRQVSSLEELRKPDATEGAFWIDRSTRTLHATFFRGAGPNDCEIEIAAQETVFAPEKPGLGFIRVKGFVVEHSAGPFPFEQVGAISTTRGHHWIIEGNTVRESNGAGIDVGIQLSRLPQPEEVGHHIVRGNVVTDCGVCGICGLGPGRGREFGLLIEDNVVLRNAYHDVEHLWETAGIKTHTNVGCLIRRNLVADTYHGPGIWMDWDNRNTRCTGNVVIGCSTVTGGIFIEISNVPNLIDSNVVWGTKGHGIYEHDSTRQIFAHNLVGASEGCGFHLHGRITDRILGAGPMVYGAHRVENNIIVSNRLPDDIRGEPGRLAGNAAVERGLSFEREAWGLKISEDIKLAEVDVVPEVPADFRGRPRGGARTIPGPFAALPKAPGRIALRSPEDASCEEAWLRDRLEAFQDLKFGFMAHWGAYSQWGCIESWPLVEEDKWARPDDLPAWIERGKDMDRFRRDYWALPRTFNPTRFDPDRWASTAKRAGMKYVVFTTKHHDGFSMFDTRLTSYRVTAPDCPFHSSPHANVVREVFDAFRKQGFAIGSYFSKADWNHPDYWSPEAPARTRNPNYDTLARPEKWGRFVDFVHGQIAELMGGQGISRQGMSDEGLSSYGPIDVLWLDAGQVRPPAQDIDMDRLVRMARSHQPRLIVVDRTVGGRHENYRTPEQEVPAEPLPYVWETCMTLGDQWSYKPHDRYKSAQRLVHLLVDVVAKGGNFLLNVGPGPDGELPAEAVSRLEEVGAWMATNGEAIYGTRPVAPYREGRLAYTRRGRTVYAILLAEKEDEAPPAEILLPTLRPAPGAEVRLLGFAEPLRWRQAEGQGDGKAAAGAGAAGKSADTIAGGAVIALVPAAARERPPCRHAFALKFEAEGGR